MPSWALTKLKETHSLDGFYAALKCGDMKKDFSALHLQETATEAGTEITQDLYSSAPEYHLNTIHERLKKTNRTPARQRTPCPLVTCSYRSSWGSHGQTESSPGSFTQKAPPTPKKKIPAGLRHNLHFTSTRFPASGLKKIYNTLILLF